MLEVHTIIVIKYNTFRRRQARGLDSELTLDIPAVLNDIKYQIADSNVLGVLIIFGVMPPPLPNHLT